MEEGFDELDFDALDFNDLDAIEEDLFEDGVTFEDEVIDDNALKPGSVLTIFATAWTHDQSPFFKGCTYASPSLPVIFGDNDGGEISHVQPKELGYGAYYAWKLTSSEGETDDILEALLCAHDDITTWRRGDSNECHRREQCVIEW